MTIVAMLLVTSLSAGPSFDLRTSGPRTLRVVAELPAFSVADSNGAAACLIPAPDGRLPQVEVAGPDPQLVRVRLGKVAVAGGVSVAPLVFERAACDEALGPVRSDVRLVYARLGGGRGWRGREERDRHGLTQRPNAMAAFIRRRLGGARLGGDAPMSAEGIGYLVIVPDEFYDNVQLLAAWKERKGFAVSVKKTSETGTTRDLIKAYIEQAYNTWSPPPSYVLLVGAISKIPAFINPGTPCVTDHPYACVDGEDFLADLFVGRLPAANASELDVMVAKILGYEMTPYVEDTSWYRRALVVGTSYQEGGTAAVTALVTKRVIRERLLERGFLQVDSVYYPPSPSGRGPVDSAVNRGVLYVNGRGWGNYEGWRYPSFVINDVGGLANGWKLPVVTSIYCGTGNYQANPCFGEVWLRAGTPAAPKGGVAFWGSSYTATSTRWNNCMDYGIYHAIFDQGIRTCGPAMYSGKLTQLQNFPLSGDSQELRSYFHVYNLLGDPSLEMWTGVPRSVSVAYPATFPVGSSSFEVRVRDLSGRPVREALVCLLKAGELHVRALTDSSGMARFAIAVSTPGSMLVTVTGSAGSALAGTALAGSGANLAPHLGSSTCVSAGVFVGHLSHDPQSAGPGRTVSLSVVLKNFGTSQTAPGVSATLRPLDGSATVSDSVRNYGDIGPGGTKSAPAFAVATAPACTSAQRIPFLVVVKSGDSTWQSGLEIPVAGPTLSSIGYTVHDGNGVLDPGETAELSVAVRNTGSGTAPGLTGVLRSVNPAAIQVLDSAGWFGDVQPGDSASCALDRFQVHASSGIGAGRRFSLRLVLRTSDGAEQLWDFPMTVGLATGSSPLGPDRHGYYAYDDTDAGYPERPVFDWVEIDPSQGGAGTHAALANDTAVPVSLPFAFRFYGREYDAVSVCDNGYLAMGSQWLGDVYNWHIPSPAGPDGLVAAFWDDFRTDTLGAPGVFTWYDAGNHRFIVEWSRCIHAHGFKPPVMADTQSFEVLLYDPQYHLTATGDGPIVVQYLAVRNDDTLFENNHNFATVGIQSPDHGDGLEYTFAGAYPVTAAEVVPGRAIRFTTNPPDTFTLIREGARSRGPASGFSIRPNPARRRVAIVPPRSGERLMLRVFDAAGRLVRRWPAGQAEWDLRDNEGVRVAAGVYQLLLADRSGSPRWRGRVLVLDE